MGDGIHFATQKRVSIRKLRKSVQQPFFFALPFSAQSSSSMGRGSSRHLLRGSRVWSPNTSFNLTLSLGRITFHPDKRWSVRTISPLDGIRISVIFSFSLPPGHRILQAQRSAVATVDISRRWPQSVYSTLKTLPHRAAPLFPNRLEQPCHRIHQRLNAKAIFGAAMIDWEQGGV